MLNIDQEEIHREYTTRFANDTVFGNGTLKAADCPCSDCLQLKQANSDPIHKALAISATQGPHINLPIKPGHIPGCPCAHCTAIELEAISPPAGGKRFNPFSVNEESYRWYK